MPYLPSKAFVQSVCDLVAQNPGGLTVAEVRARCESAPRLAVVTEALKRLVEAGNIVVTHRNGEPVYVPVAGAPQERGKKGSSEAFAVVAEAGSEVDCGAAAKAAEPEVTGAPGVASQGADDEAPDLVADGAEIVPAETLADAPELAEIFGQLVGVIVTAALPRSQSTLVLQGAVFRSVPMPDRATAVARLKARLEGFSLEEAIACGIEADQYRRWRAVHTDPHGGLRWAEVGNGASNEAFSGEASSKMPREVSIPRSNTSNEALVRMPREVSMPRDASNEVSGASGRGNTSNGARGGGEVCDKMPREVFSGNDAKSDTSRRGMAASGQRGSEREVSIPRSNTSNEALVRMPREVSMPRDASNEVSGASGRGNTSNEARGGGEVFDKMPREASMPRGSASAEASGRVPRDSGERGMPQGSGVGAPRPHQDGEAGRSGEAGLPGGFATRVPRSVLILAEDLVDLARREGVMRVVDIGLVVVGILLVGEVCGLGAWASGFAPVVGAAMAFGRRSGKGKATAQGVRLTARLRGFGVVLIVVLGGWSMWQQHRIWSIAGMPRSNPSADASGSVPGRLAASTPPTVPATVAGRPAATPAESLPREAAAGAPSGVGAGSAQAAVGRTGTGVMEGAVEAGGGGRGTGSWVAAGTLFGGVAYKTAHPGPQVVVLEIVSASATPGAMVAALHNDGGWAEARTLAGEWAVNASGEGCSVTLRTGAEQRVAGGGPVLDEAGAHTLRFDVTARGQVVPISLPWQLELERLSEIEATRRRAWVERPQTECLAATEPGLVYEGEAVSKLQETTESLRLRFVDRDAGGRRFEAVVESMMHPGWSRRFSGGVMPNRYRSGPNLIQLTSPDRERVAQAGQRTVLGHDSTLGGLTVALHPVGRRLVGESGYFRYEFERVETARAGQDVNASETLGMTAGPDARGQAGERVAAATGSGANPAREDAEGRAEGRRNAVASASSATEVGSGRGVNAAGTSNFAGDSGAEGAAGVAAKAAPAVAGVGSVAGAAVPRDSGLAAFPTAAGVYVATGGGWVALKPTSTPATERATRAASKVVAALSAFSPSLARQVPDVPTEQLANLALELATESPTVPAGEIVIVAVGEAAAGAAVERQSALRHLPLIEVAAANLAPNGKRVAALVRLAPDVVTFGPARLPATVEQPRPGIAVLRCGSVRPGTYSVRCGEKVYGVAAE